MQLNSVRGMQSFSLKEIHGFTSTFTEDAHTSSPLASRSLGVQLQISIFFLDYACIKAADESFKGFIFFIGSITNRNFIRSSLIMRLIYFHFLMRRDYRSLRYPHYL